MTRHRLRSAAFSVLIFLLLAEPQAAELTSNEDSSTASVCSVTDMDVYGAVGLCIMSCSLVLSAAGGVGGGVIMVPTMVLVLGFDIKVATPVSNFAIMGGGVANAWFNMRKRHPTVDRPLIDPDLALIVIPAIIGGVVIGTVMANLFPSYLLSLLMVVVLVAGNTRMLLKAIVMIKIESAARKEAAIINSDVESASFETTDYVKADEAESSAGSEPFVTLSPTPSRSTSSELSTRGAVARGDPSVDTALAEIINTERCFHWSKHGAVLGCYMILVAFSISDALVTCGGVTYWAFLVAEIPLVVVFELFAVRRLLQEHETKKALSYPFVDGDV